MRVKGNLRAELAAQTSLSLTHIVTLQASDNQAEFYCEASSDAAIPNKKTTSAKTRYNVLCKYSFFDHSRIVWLLFVRFRLYIARMRASSLWPSPWQPSP